MSSSTSSTTFASTATAHHIPLPFILAAVVAGVAVFSCLIFVLIFFRGFAKRFAIDPEASADNTKGENQPSRKLSLREIQIVRLPQSLDFFPFKLLDLIPSRRAPIFDEENGVITYPVRDITPATPKKSSRFMASRLQQAAAFSPIPILQFTPPTPRKGGNPASIDEVVPRDTLHPLYGSVLDEFVIHAEVLALPTGPSSKFFF